MGGFVLGRSSTQPFGRGSSSSVAFFLKEDGRPDCNPEEDGKDQLDRAIQTSQNKLGREGCIKKYNPQEYLVRRNKAAEEDCINKQRKITQFFGEEPNNTANIASVAPININTLAIPVTIVIRWNFWIFFNDLRNR